MFEEIVERLQQCPHAKYTVTGDFVSVPPISPDGFEVSIHHVWGSQFVVFFDSWNEEFDNYKLAMDWFFLGLSGRCRILALSKGGIRFGWALERLEDTGWVECARSKKLIFPFWRATTTSYLQNRLFGEA